MDICQFQQAIEELKKIRKFINIAVVKSFNTEVYEFMMASTSFLPIESNFRERLYCIEHGIKERPICPVCKKNFLKFLKSGRYADGCCKSCVKKSDAYKQRMLAKYGYESPNQSPEVKQHKVDSLMQDYGVTNAFQIPSVKEHAKEKSLSEHGVEHWTNREQGIKTYFEKTGYKNPSQNPEVKAQKQKTCMTNYGVSNPSSSEEISQQKVETCLANFGVEYGYMLNKHVVYNQVSNLNKRMYKILEDNGIEFEKEFRIQFDGRYRAYDIMIPCSKLIIELNGDFWHANPKMHKAEDKLNFPHIGEMLVEDIWKNDAFKRKLAEDNGYRVLYFWESDFKKMSDQQVIEMVKMHMQ